MLILLFLQWLGLIIFCYALFEIFSLILFGSIAKYLGYTTHPYRRERSGKTVIILGDSTVAGTGSERPEFSLAGRLGAEFPLISIRNYAKVGMGTRELAVFLRDHPDMKADLVIIQIGGIDTLTLRPLTHFSRRLDYIFASAKKISAGRVVVSSSANLGTIPFFRFPLSCYFEERTRKIRALFLEATESAEVSYVDLFEEKAADPFRQSPHLLFASDGIHPNGEGYGLWYTKLREVLSTERYDELLKYQ